MVGWIADAPDFEHDRALELVRRYREVRHLLVGEWYPLLPYSSRPDDWIASQYHRPDLAEGMVLAFRRPQCPFPEVEISLHALEPEAVYQVTCDTRGEEFETTGRALAEEFSLTLPHPRMSELLVYRRAD